MAERAQAGRNEPALGRAETNPHVADTSSSSAKPILNPVDMSEQARIRPMCGQFWPNFDRHEPTLGRINSIWEPLSGQGPVFGVMFWCARAACLTSQACRALPVLPRAPGRGGGVVPGHFQSNSHKQGKIVFTSKRHSPGEQHVRTSSTAPCSVATCSTSRASKTPRSRAWPASKSSRRRWPSSTCATPIASLGIFVTEACAPSSGGWGEGGTIFVVMSTTLLPVLAESGSGAPLGRCSSL